MTRELNDEVKILLLHEEGFLHRTMEKLSAKKPPVLILKPIKNYRCIFTDYCRYKILRVVLSGREMQHYKYKKLIYGTRRKEI